MSASEAVGAIFISKRTGRVLMNLRSSTVNYGLSWGFFGGKVEKDELVLDALYREITEEVGLTLDIVDIIPFDIFTTKNNKFKYYSFIAIVQDEFIPLLNSESSGYAWTDIGVSPKPLHPGARNCLTTETLLADFKALVESLRTGKPFVNSLPYPYST